MREIKFSKHNISSSDMSLLNKSIKSGWLTHGKYATEFEKELCHFTKANMQFLFLVVLQNTFILFIAGFKKGD